MATQPDDVAAPAQDTVLFRLSAARMFAIMLPIMVLSALAAMTLVKWAFGTLDQPENAVGWLLPQAGVFGLVMTGSFAWRARRSPTWVRTSSAGLELASNGGDPVFLAWPDIRSAVIRRPGLLAILEVTPTDIGLAWQAGPRPDRSRVRDRSGGPAFVLEVGLLDPGPGALRAELARRRMPPPSAATS